MTSVSLLICFPRGIKIADPHGAIWDNRSAFHSATYDYDGLGDRSGNRAVGIGEAPYLDPHSQSRTEALVEGL